MMLYELHSKIEGAKISEDASTLNLALLFHYIKPYFVYIIFYFLIFVFCCVFFILISFHLSKCGGEGLRTILLKILKILKIIFPLFFRFTLI